MMDVLKPMEFEGQNAIERLSKRQRECVRLVGQGFTSKEIARRINVSPSTVDNHIRSALVRLGMNSRMEAARGLRAIEAPETDMIGSCDGVGETTGRLNHLAQPDVPHQRHPLRLPPLGGERNALSLQRRFFHVGQVALLAVMSLAALTITIAGIVNLFHR